MDAHGSLRMPMDLHGDAWGKNKKANRCKISVYTFLIVPHSSTHSLFRGTNRGFQAPIARPYLVVQWLTLKNFWKLSLLYQFSSRL